MKLEHDELLLARALGWRPTLAAIAVALAAILVFYRETVLSMVALWGSSDTYAHGYLVLPIVLYLLWTQRRQLVTLSPRPDWLGFAILVGAGFAWLIANAAQVQVLQQYAMTAMIPLAVLAIAGRRVAWGAAFPLLFLLLAVPFGEAFIPRLMQWTADFAVGALRITGIPVYREGNMFTIPSGRWSVVEACSGLRYLIASITVGSLFAYLSYRRWWKRAAFIALSIAVPIVANFFRAYIIVMIGHVSGMRLAVGVDHFIYGWVFFGFVIALLFWIGSLWRDPPAASAKPYVFITGPSTGAPRTAVAAAVVVMLVAAWPLYARYLDDRGDTQSVVLTAPREMSGWSLESQRGLNWHPQYNGVAASTLAVYRNGDRTVAVYLAHYRNQREGAELVSAQNLVEGGSQSAWVSVEQTAHWEDVWGARLSLRQTRLRADGQPRLMVWDWYRIDGRDISNPFLAKAFLARDKLLGRPDHSTAIVLASPYAENPASAVETLRAFLRDMMPAIDDALYAVQGRAG